MILNKAKFNTSIGFLHYLWTGNENDPRVVCLSSDSNSFDKYLEEIILPGNDAVLSEKKCIHIENRLKNYLEEKIRDTGLKVLFMTGTAFEKNVWNTAIRIPYGKTLSYGEIALKCGYPGAGRAAGNALGKNPVMIIVPCHRIIKGDGSLGGFTAGKEIKKILLSIESF